MDPQTPSDALDVNTLRERAYRVLRDADAPRSLTGKRLSGANARRRRQAHRRAMLATFPATYEYWQSRPQDGTQRFTLKTLRVLASQCVIPPEAYRRSYDDNRALGVP